jgi:iron(II)-dependent oxidoreductase
MMTMPAVDNETDALVSRLYAAREETDALFQLVKTEAMYDRPIPERHRIAFYVGHLEAFDWNLLKAPEDVSARPEYDRLFAFGIDPVGGNLPADTAGDWPVLSEVRGYRRNTRQAVDELVLGASAELLNVAIEHRLMHAETLAYILHQMTFDRKNAMPVARVLSPGALLPGSVRIPAGDVTLGLRRDAGIFAWDNEFEAHRVDVASFSIDRYAVTNGQFLQFLLDGGYDNRALWKDADWEWRGVGNISHPKFWLGHGRDWSYRSMFQEISLPSDRPVYVSHAEASAYACWAGKRLPTEAEWQRAADIGVAGGLREAARDAWDPAPVNAGNAANGWEWTSTVFAPFEGFRRFACYPGYSEPFFDGKHYVLKGGSVRTAGCMLRPSFRNWFQPHYQYVYSGFRCVSGEADE